MDVYEVIRRRYSVRAYKTDAVEEEKLQRVLDAARWAPTAANRQAFRLLVLSTRGRSAELRRIYDREWFVEPPILICACALPDQAWRRRDGTNYSHVDVAIVMDHLILAATGEGLGTCWVAAFDVEAARAVLDLPVEWEPVVFTPLGYAAGKAPTKERKPLEVLIEDRRIAKP
jgi:nitroreductase